MSQPLKNLPPEVKDEIIKAGEEVLEDYSKTDSTTNMGAILRKIAKVVRRFLPFAKYVKINKNAKI